MSAVGGTEAGTGGRGVEAEMGMDKAWEEGSEAMEERKSDEVVTDSDLESSGEETRDAIDCGGGFRVWRRRRRWRRMAWRGGDGARREAMERKRRCLMASLAEPFLILHKK